MLQEDKSFETVSTSHQSSYFTKGVPLDELQTTHILHWSSVHIWLSIDYVTLPRYQGSTQVTSTTDTFPTNYIMIQGEEGYPQYANKACCYSDEEFY